MDTMLELKKQIEKVILLLEHQLIDDPDRPILKTLYERYMRAEEILINNDDIKKIMYTAREYLEGGCFGISYGIRYVPGITELELIEV